MSGPMPPAELTFETDVLRHVAEVRQLARTEDNPRFFAELKTVAPSIIGSKAIGVHEVVVKVRRGSDIWSDSLEAEVRAEVETHQSPNMAPVRLKVVPY